MANKLAFAALLVLVLAIGASATPPKKVLRVRVAYLPGERVSTPGYDTKVTSYRTFAGSFYSWDSYNIFLGFADGVATVLKVRPTFKISDVHFTYVFKGVGTVSVAGYTDSSLPVNTLAITGGTGAYNGASGYLTVKSVAKAVIPKSESELDVTFYFK